MLQLPPGPERRDRDATWREQKTAYVDRDVLSGGGNSSAGSSSGDDTEETQELRRQWMEFFEVWGYDARDAAESWWVEWGALREQASRAKKRAEEYQDDEMFNSLRRPESP